jgi:hypothetical protein
MESRINLYHENMTSFSLFHQPSFQTKLRKITSTTQLSALLAAMFSYSARFENQQSQVPSEMGNPTVAAKKFGTLAIYFVEKSLQECSDETPPLCVLQAVILNTFQQLTKGVRGNAWRYLGTCVRLAYELSLYLVDSGKAGPSRENKMDKWSADEERRRAWWAIWELDTFASTVRRRPTAIDWSQNETHLPVKDEIWFSQKYQRSCFLAQKPIDRWKLLQESGNDSPKAWYIVVNSLMRDAQCRSSSIVGLESAVTARLQFFRLRPAGNSHESDDISDNLSILSHALRCFSLALPQNLQYRGEYLSFTSSDAAAAIPCRQLHIAKYSIYLMMQLTKFMIYHQQAFMGICQPPGHKDGASICRPSESATEVSSGDRSENNALSLYLQAADNILTLVNCSSDDHVQHVSPLWASTVWLAAAVQLVYKVLGPRERNMDLIDSKFEVLQLVHKQFVDFWETPSVLQHNLESLEEQLERWRAPPDSDVSQGHSASNNDTSSCQEGFVQVESPISSSCPQQIIGVGPSSITTYPGLSENLSDLSMHSSSLLALQSDAQSRTSNTPQSQNLGADVAYGPYPPFVPLGNNSFDGLNSSFQWDLGVNDDLPFYLNEILLGSFVQ